MVILKKIKSATLMETLVATVLIVVIFMMASMILNNSFSNHIKHNTHQIQNHIYELKYNYLTNTLELPYNTKYKSWDISMYLNDGNSKKIIIKAVNLKTQKQIEQYVYGY